MPTKKKAQIMNVYVRYYYMVAQHFGPPLATD